MAIDTDDEILQDFLVEADEILEKLGEQLVDLEQSPEDSELLNAVFRGFHTIKGGAGFLALTALVEVCHHAEDVFNILRQGDRVVDASLMDAFLRVTDSVNDMFGEVREGTDPTPADPELIETLKRFLSGDDEPEQASASTPEPVVEIADASDSGKDITDDEFESLLDQLHGGGAPTAVEPDASVVKKKASGLADDGLITDGEFEDLLDELHGKGGMTKVEAPAENSPLEKNEAQPAVKVEAVVKPVTPAKPLPATAAVKKKENAPAQAETTVRVDTKRLDDIMNLVGELVLVRNRLSTLESTKSDEAMTQAVANLDLVTTDLQNSVMKTRMQPIKKVFGRFPRVVRDLARSLKKEVGLELIGEETDLDKNLVEALADPLVHLIRNSVDHGIELPDVREKAGKDRAGAVVLSAAQEGDHILLTIDDDGAGMDADKLRSIAVSKGLYDEDAAARLDDKECFNLIFMPGFSTKEEISDISGRGVGMDVVKTRIAQLNGSIDIDSTMGKGSRIAIKLPLTLAIMPTLMVLLEEQVFALPLVSVVEIFNLDLTESKVVDGQPVVLIRNKALPIFYLREWLIKGASRSEKQKEGHVVVVSAGAQQVGFVVDQLIGQEEVVIKPLGSMLHGTRGLAGATITGNGKISLILDVPELLTAYA